MNLRRTFSLVVASALLTTVLGGTALAQSSNPQVGTWKLNVAKSKSWLVANTLRMGGTGSAKRRFVR